MAIIEEIIKIMNKYFPREGNKMIFKFKFTQGIHPTYEQMREIIEYFKTVPNHGWNYNHDTKKNDLIEDHHWIGEEGEYYYRINLAWNLVTFTEIY